MSVRQSGFSLIEALISLLVLSVGLLGLGQLQATLWKSGGQLYAVSEAYLLSASYLERGLSAGAPEPAAQENRMARSGSGYTDFDAAVQLEQQGWVKAMDVASHWQDTSGAHTVRLRSSVYQPAISDSRWLLSPE